MNKGMGSALLTHTSKLRDIVKAASSVMHPLPFTVKLRVGYNDGKPVAHKLTAKLADWGASAVVVHGRTRAQRYSKKADWEYIQRCGEGLPIPLIGNGDVYDHEDLQAALGRSTITTVMVARGALIKPWIFTELRERRHWDISASERMDYIRDYVEYGLDHWGSVRRRLAYSREKVGDTLSLTVGLCGAQDNLGVSRTRHFLLEWLSWSHRYVPLGLLESFSHRPQLQRQCRFRGRSDLETLLGSSSHLDWIKITEMFLGPAPPDFHYVPKHKSSAQQGQALTTWG